jgi:hypothetical protein
MAGTAVDEDEQLSDEQIAVIKQGWDGAASVDDLAVSAHALYAIGCYNSALEEFSILIQRGYSPHQLIRPMAKSLAHLKPPQELAEAVDRLAARLIKDPKANFAFKLSLAEELIESRQIDSSFELCRRLDRCAAIPSAYRSRLEALKKKLNTSPRKARSRTRKKEHPDGSVSAPASVMERMRSAVKAFTARMRPPKSGA